MGAISGLINFYQQTINEDFEGKRSASVSAGKGQIKITIDKDPRYIKLLSDAGIDEIWKDWVYEIVFPDKTERFAPVTVKVKNLDFDEVDKIIIQLREQHIHTCLIGYNLSGESRACAKPMEYGGKITLNTCTTHDGTVLEGVEVPAFTGRLAEVIHKITIGCMIWRPTTLSIKSGVHIPPEFLAKIYAQSGHRRHQLLIDYYPKLQNIS